jgi:hypothetical protein
MKLCDDVFFSNSTKDELLLIKLVNDESVYKLEGALINIVKMIKEGQKTDQIISSLVKETGRSKEEVTLKFDEAIKQLVNLKIVEL